MSAKKPAPKMNTAQARALRAHALEMAQRIRSDNSRAGSLMSGVANHQYTADMVIADAEKLAAFILK